MIQIDYDSIAPLYDAYVTEDFDTAYFSDEARRSAGPVIELTSGTGRLSIPLVEAGVDLTCVDYSQGMLDVLSRKLHERKLRATVLRADVCQLGLPAKFNLALLPFHSFAEIVGEERQRSALASVFACLRPGGRFICTMHNPAIRRAQVDGVLRIVGSFPFEEGYLVVSGFEQGGQPVVSRQQFFEYFISDGHLVWKRLLPMQFELIEPERFRAMALAAGFRVVQVHGDYQRTEFDPAKSPVMLWHLEKPA